MHVDIYSPNPSTTIRRRHKVFFERSTVFFFSHACCLTKAKKTQSDWYDYCIDKKLKVA